VKPCCGRQDRSQQQEIAQQLIEQCEWLEENVDPNGPFFMGSQFSLVVGFIAVQHPSMAGLINL